MEIIRWIRSEVCTFSWRIYDLQKLYYTFKWNGNFISVLQLVSEGENNEMQNFRFEPNILKWVIGYGSRRILFIKLFNMLKGTEHLL